MRWGWWVGALLALLVPVAGATSYVALEPAEMFERAELVFYADVIAVDTVIRGDDPWTVVEFDPREILRRPVDDDAEGNGIDDDGVGPDDDVDAVDAEPGDTLTLSFLGGERGELRLAVAAMPGFEVGDVVLVLAYDVEPVDGRATAPPVDAVPASPLVGFRQGVWYVRGGVLRDADDRTLSLIDGALARGGPPTSAEDLLPRLRELAGTSGAAESAP